jgi:hypothetical protein
MARNAAVSLTPGNLASRLLKVVWLAILLGLGLQALLLLTALGFGKELQLDAVVAESVNKVAWAFLVCFGLALDSAAPKLGPTSFALAGLLAAPVAFIAARSLHKSVAQALDVQAGAVSESVLVFALFKAIEYGVLGYLLARIGARTNARPQDYA